MSKHAHTPGPWSVSGRCGPGFTGKGNGDYYCYVCNEDTAQVVATVWNFSGCGEANSALLAAAPEMLKVLEKIAGLLDFCELEKLIDKNLEREIRKAIQKAKGELKP